MVTTRSRGKRAPATEDLESMDEGERKRLNIGMVDHPSGGSPTGNNNDIGAGALSLPAQADVDTLDALTGVSSNDNAAGVVPAQAPATVAVPVVMDGTGAVNAASGGGGGTAGAAVEEGVTPAELIVNGIVVDDDILASRSILRGIQEEPAKETKREWYRLFWERGVFTRWRKKGEAAAMKREAPAKAEALAATLKMAREAAAAHAAAGSGSAPAPTFVAAEGAPPAGIEEGAADMDGDGGDDGCSYETTEEPRMSQHFEEFLGRKRVEWAHEKDQQRRAIAAFRVDEEALAGTAPHVKDGSHYQQWLKEHFVATCGGQGRAKFSGGLGGATSGKEGAPSTRCAGTGAAGIGPLGELFDNLEDGISCSNTSNGNLDTYSTGTTDEEPCDLSPEKAGHTSSFSSSSSRSPSPSPSASPYAIPPPSANVDTSNDQGQGRSKGKGKRRSVEQDEADDENADADGSNDRRGAHCTMAMPVPWQKGYNAGTTATSGNGGGVSESALLPMRTMQPGFRAFAG
eukprot:g16812.t1